MKLFGDSSQAFAAPVSQQDHTALITDVATKVVRRRMTAPATILLESVKPLSRLAGQALVCASPLCFLFVAPEKMAALCDLLEDRKNIDRLLEAIEAQERAFHESHSQRKST